MERSPLAWMLALGGGPWNKQGAVQERANATSTVSIAANGRGLMSRIQSESTLMTTEELQTDADESPRPHLSGLSKEVHGCSSGPGSLCSSGPLITEMNGTSPLEREETPHGGVGESRTVHSDEGRRQRKVCSFDLPGFLMANVLVGGRGRPSGFCVSRF